MKEIETLMALQLITLQQALANYFFKHPLFLLSAAMELLQFTNYED